MYARTPSHISPQPSKTRAGRTPSSIARLQHSTPPSQTTNRVANQLAPSANSNIPPLPASATLSPAPFADSSPSLPSTNRHKGRQQ